MHSTGFISGCVGGQELKEDDPSVLGLDMSAHELGAMRLQAVPDDQQLLTDGLLQHLLRIPLIVNAVSTRW